MSQTKEQWPWVQGRGHLPHWPRGGPVSYPTRGGEAQGDQAQLGLLALWTVPPEGRGLVRKMGSQGALRVFCLTILTSAQGREGQAGLWVSLPVLGGGTGTYCWAFFFFFLIFKL